MFGEISPKLPVAQINKPSANYIALCSANQGLTGSYVDIGGCSITIGPGTWFVTGTVTLATGSANDVRVKIYYASTDLVSSRISLNNGFAGTVTIHGIITVANYQILKMAAAEAGGSFTIYKSDTLSSGPTGTYLIAVRIA